MLRFAPSPTHDMDLRDLRIALLNYVVSQQKGEDFIVRFNDLDKDKVVEEKDKDFLGILDLFNVRYTQVIHQSENFRFHSAMALQLLHEKKAFSCFCSDEWLTKKMDEAKSAKISYKYDDACASLPAELVIDNLNPFSVRIHKSNHDVIVKDLIQGDVAFSVDEQESFVIMNRDKTPTEIFATAVDDMLNDISYVIQDEEFIEDVPKQEYVRKSLQYDKKIEYAHVPPILDANVSVIKLLEEGFLPEAILNYLVSSLNEDFSETFSIEDLIKRFSFKNSSLSPVSFDKKQLAKINQKYLMQLDPKELSRYLGFADEEIGLLAKVFIANVHTMKELRAKVEPIFEKKTFADEISKEANEVILSIKNAPYFDSYEDFKTFLLNNNSIDESLLEEILQITFTGSKQVVNLSEVYKYLKNYLGEIIK